MEHNRVFRISDDDIDELRARTRDEAIIDAYATWVTKTYQLDPLVHKIEEAFAGLILGEGIGLLEAKGIDDYSTEDELARLRSRDEHTDWPRIDVETLNSCYSAPTFMDARGFIFHLPAFLIAELNDNFSYGFIDRLIHPDRLPSGWIELLDAAQRGAVADVLSLVTEHPDYCERRDEIATVIERLRGKAG